MKRIHYLPKQKMQIALTLRLLLLTVLFAFFVGFEVYITVWPVVSEFIPRALMSAVKEQILFRVVFFSIPLLFVICAFFVIFTHRIAGPLYRLEQTLDRLIRGEEDVEPLHLRKHDELGELTFRINTLISMIKEHRTR
jgi:signal transduction histidine kinase